MKRTKIQIKLYIVDRCHNYKHEFQFKNIKLVDVEHDWKVCLLSEWKFIIHHSHNNVNKKENIDNLNNYKKKLLQKIFSVR